MVVELCALISFCILSYSIESLLMLVFKMLNFLLVSDYSNVVLVLGIVADAKPSRAAAMEQRRPL